jgi:superfamily II DNA or RNA helicase/HKD family nuclease
VSEPLAEGLYESLHTTALDVAVAETNELVPHFAAVEAVDAPEVLARHIAEAARTALATESNPGRRLIIVNSVLDALASPELKPSTSLEQMLALLRRDRAELAERHVRPTTPLADSALLTNAKGEPGLGAELRAELASADSVDLLCAFIRWHGLRVLEDQLAGLHERGVQLRVLTTTYVGATERRAIDALVRRFGAEVRINYETQSTRLHAKAWLFRRNSGFDTAYVGSSNLSRSALVEGLEWNVRLSGVTTASLIRKFDATFASYWADPAFLEYDPDVDADRLDDALARAANRTVGTATTINLSGLEVRPFPHQELILTAVDAERSVHHRHRNLVVAATGTGKTLIAALDFRRLQHGAGRDLSLLFVAHRYEILDQSLRAYREVLVDGAFGELYVGGTRPDRWRHVFASVQSLASYGVEHIARDHFDVVVIDEFHHAEAPTYRRLLDHLRPVELLGLTATPERSDGVDVREFFGGRTAAELRLWDALEADLLVPFHYFGVSDDVNLSSVEWKRGTYDPAGLDSVYTGNDARAAKVLRELRDKVADVGQMRAIGFCVSVAHAEYMARVFNGAGVPALAVSGGTNQGDRADALRRLETREVNCLFAADLYNEGLDLPQVDTVLLLRPTQSATVFLQQLGRGLRRAPGKAVLTVLDFIGQQRREFRFDMRFRMLTGTSRKGLEKQIEQGFPFLPSGSQVVLDRIAQRVVLDNVRAQLRMSMRDLAADVRSHGERRLADYLRESGIDLPDIYRRATWTRLARQADFYVPPPGPGEDALLGRIKRVVHVDDSERAATYAQLCTPDGPRYEELSQREQRLARMFFFTLWPSAGRFTSYNEGLAHLRRHPAVCDEIAQLVDISLDDARHVPHGLGEGLQHVPLASHARYGREEILAALGYASLDRRVSSHVSGVAWCEETRTDALLVNLNKSEEHFSPSTMYRDYALSPELFHWESQNATAVDSPTGRRYLTHRESGSRVVLFIRDAPSDEIGTAPFMCLGQVDYVSHHGERPIAITWKLLRPMPADTYVAASAVAR